MNMNIFETPATAALHRGMNFACTRQRLLLNNIANFDTPDYAPRDLDFNQYMQISDDEPEPPFLIRSSAVHLREVTEPEGSRLPLKTLATASLEREMGELAKNTLYFSAVVQARNMYCALNRIAVTEGKR
jgi:flagellar basal-body rod protein FlgB